MSVVQQVTLKPVCLQLNVGDVGDVGRRDTNFSFEVHLTNAEEENEVQENAVSTLGP